MYESCYYDNNDVLIYVQVSSCYSFEGGGWVGGAWGNRAQGHEAFARLICRGKVWPSARPVCSHRGCICSHRGCIWSSQGCFSLRFKAKKGDFKKKQF